MFTINKQVMSRLQNRVQYFMPDTVLVTRPSAAVFDSQSGKVMSPGSITIYEGIARVSSSSGPETMVLGEELISYRTETVHLPWDVPLPRRDDLITVIQSSEPGLQGRILRVVDVQVGTYSVSRQITCTETEPSRTWES